VLPDQPAGAIEARVAGPVPVLDGFDADDGATFVPSSVTTVAAFDRWVSSVFTGAAPAVERHYPVPAGAGRAVVRAVAAEVVTDAGFACPAVNLEQLLATRQPGRVWGYVFADPRATPAGDVHGSELGYLFGARGAPVPDGAAPLVAAMDAAWGAMLRSGDPSPAWPASTPSGSVVERLAPPAPSPEADEAVDHSCSFWSADGGGR
jgi:para-nitrobenzyl esterase